MQNLFFKQLIVHIHNALGAINIKPSELNIEKTSKCLVLTAKSSNELLGMGGLILKNPEQFDVYCLTNSFKDIDAPDLAYEEKVAFKNKEFSSVMELVGVNYYHFFENIDPTRLVMRYDRFKTISLAEYDYIFIPNILEQNRDDKAISVLLEELLKNRPYKNDVKIVMYETNVALALPNAFVDIEDNFDKKIELVDKYHSASHNFQTKLIKSLNSFRGISAHRNYAEAYCILDVKEFKHLSKMYSL